jgi:hypothetical protein
MRTLRARRPPGDVSEAEVTAICEGVEQLLRGALSAARGDDPKYRSFRSWWRGTSVEAAFRKSHQAESELMRLYSDEEIEAEIPSALGRAEVSLSRDDPMRHAAAGLLQAPAGPGKRALLSKVVQVSHEAADGSHTRIRNFRNILLMLSLCLTVLLIAFALLVWRNPSIVPLCFRQQGGGVACPTGQGRGRVPEPLDVFVVALLGLLGGSLAAALSIRGLRGTETPYDIPVALALLKAPTGVLTAIGALIAIRGAFIPGLSQLDSQQQILAYALVFGYAQQLLTGLIDKQAEKLLGSVPSKDAEQSRPELPALRLPTLTSAPGTPPTPSVEIPASR